MRERVVLVGGFAKGVVDQGAFARGSTVVDREMRGRIGGIGE